MISSLNIQTIILPPLFLFNSLTLIAKFTTTSVPLTTIFFNSSQLSRERHIKVNVMLKVPETRSCFRFRLEVQIVNMRIQPVEIPVDLGSCGDSRHLEFIFLTEVGKVSLLVNIVEEIYLPKEQVNIGEVSSEQETSKVEESSSLSHSSIVSLPNHYNQTNGDLKPTQNNVEKRQDLLKRKAKLQERIKRHEQKLSMSRSEYMKLQLQESLNESLNSGSKPKMERRN